jgi:general secretion pathway protein G
MKTNRQRNPQRGYTLVELIVVMAIIGLLTAIAVPTFKNIMRRGRETVLRANLYAIRDQIDNYYSDKGHYPKSLEDLVHDGGYFRSHLPTDPITKKIDWEEVKLSDVPSDEGLGEISADEDGIWDVKSKAEGKGLDGTKYSEW